MDIFRGLIGMAFLLAIALALSNNRKLINWRLVLIGLGIQLTLGVFILKGEQMAEVFSPLGWPKILFSGLSYFFVAILEFTTEGAQFVFGDLALSPGADNSYGFFFAFQVLPTIVFFASLTTLLYHYGVLQWIVSKMATGMRKLMGVSGAESLSVTANIFIGQTESPLLIKPYIENMTRSELLTLMTGGMATIAGGIMAAYIQLLGDSYAAIHDISLDAGRLIFAEQLLGASIMAAPAALVIAKILYPEDKTPATMGEVKINVEQTDANGIDAAATGASEGMRLALNVGAMLLAFIALLAMGNSILSWFGDIVGLNQAYGITLTIQSILGYIFAPFAFMIGIPWADAINMGSMLGTKLVLTEFIAYIELSEAITNDTISQKTIIMATFALCGFANFTSIAIQIGGIGGIAPGRKAELAEFGVKAVLAGTMANLMTATIAGVLYS
ncbi:MAG: nucleoside transporter C-terminal domain-containing protein [Balneolales bacterium]